MYYVLCAAVCYVLLVNGYRVCTICYALCGFSYALRGFCYALCALWYGMKLCAFQYNQCAMRYPLCAMRLPLHTYRYALALRRSSRDLLFLLLPWLDTSRFGMLVGELDRFFAQTTFL